jgi:hypothetical protein
MSSISSVGPLSCRGIVGAVIRVDCGASTALTGKHNVVGWPRRFVKKDKTQVGT